VGIDLSQHNSAELEPTAVSPVHVSSDDSKHDCSGSSEEWDERDAEESVEPSTDIRQPHAPRKGSAFIKWIAILIIAFQSALFLPNPAAEWVLHLLRTVLSVLSVLCPHPFLAGVLAIIISCLFISCMETIQFRQRCISQVCGLSKL